MTLSRRSIPIVALCLSFVALVAFPDPGAAQDDRAHSLAPGAWALQFSIVDNFRLSSFEGSMLSIKRHSSAGSAFRLGVSTSFLSSDQSTPDTTGSFPLRDEDLSFVSVQLQYMHYPRPGSDVNLYLAVGPEFSRQSSTATEDLPVGEVELTNRLWSAGVEGNLGLEWFPFRSVGVHAEYGAAIEFSSITSGQDYSDPMGTDRKIETDRWSFRGTGVAFGASVYF